MRSILRAAPVALTLFAVGGVKQVEAQATPKIAYVNTQALMDAAPGRVSADSAFQKFQDGLRLSLQKTQDSIQAKIADYTKKEPTLTAVQKDAKQKELQSLETDFQAKQLQAQQQASQKQQELYAPIQEAVKKVIEDIRQEDGYAIIFANDPQGSAIVAADKNLDITDRLVNRLRTVAAVTKTNKAALPANAPAGPTRPKPPGQ